MRNPFIVKETWSLTFRSLGCLGIVSEDPHSVLHESASHTSAQIHPQLTGTLRGPGSLGKHTRLEGRSLQD